MLSVRSKFLLPAPGMSMASGNSCDFMPTPPSRPGFSLVERSAAHQPQRLAHPYFKQEVHRDGPVIFDDEGVLGMMRQSLGATRIRLAPDEGVHAELMNRVLELLTQCGSTVVAPKDFVLISETQGKVHMPYEHFSARAVFDLGPDPLDRKRIQLIVMAQGPVDVGEDLEQVPDEFKNLSKVTLIFRKFYSDDQSVEWLFEYTGSGQSSLRFKPPNEQSYYTVPTHHDQSLTFLKKYLPLVMGQGGNLNHGVLNFEAFTILDAVMRQREIAQKPEFVPLLQEKRELGEPPFLFYFPAWMRETHYQRGHLFSLECPLSEIVHDERKFWNAAELLQKLWRDWGEECDMKLAVGILALMENDGKSQAPVLFFEQGDQSSSALRIETLPTQFAKSTFKILFQNRHLLQESFELLESLYQDLYGSEPRSYGGMRSAFQEGLRDSYSYRNFLNIDFSRLSDEQRQVNQKIYDNLFSLGRMVAISP